MKCRHQRFKEHTTIKRSSRKTARALISDAFRDLAIGLKAKRTFIGCGEGNRRDCELPNTNSAAAYAQPRRDDRYTPLIGSLRGFTKKKPYSNYFRNESSSAVVTEIEQRMKLCRYEIRKASQWRKTGTLYLRNTSLRWQFGAAEFRVFYCRKRERREPARDGDGAILSRHLQVTNCASARRRRRDDGRAHGERSALRHGLSRDTGEVRGDGHSEGSVETERANRFELKSNGRKVNVEYLTRCPRLTSDPGQRRSGGARFFVVTASAVCLSSTVVYTQVTEHEMQFKVYATSVT
ncbi:hypothetical protein EVAR_35894_1 [Eumeta japonica]|uniref:Uncharacterized protein n=1 Tax=Eumeta variegata TaxID=151549 RepID=A0A4C1WVH4_EUMVA|nr:hypothetical protein EVAR_35894_1 [Eumeta japonica]